MKDAAKLLAALGIIAALVFVGLSQRYEVNAASVSWIIRTDRLTGHVERCSIPAREIPKWCEGMVPEKYRDRIEAR